MINIKNAVRKYLFPNTYSSAAYVKFLKDKRGIDIGEHCYFWSPNKTKIDIQRPHMLHIGDYVKVTSDVTILCHDFSRSVFLNAGLGNVGEARETWIGDNVFIGMNSIILMGTHIGNNCIVGAGAVVSGHFEDNVVIAGNPARVICTLEGLYEKRKREQIGAAKLYVKKWRKKNGTNPTAEDMTNAFAWLYFPHNENTLKENPQLFTMNGVDIDAMHKKFLDTEEEYSSFEEFLSEC